MSKEGLISDKDNIPSYKKPLEEDEIILAEILLKESHELMDTPLGDVFPLLRPCSSKGKKESGEGGHVDKGEDEDSDEEDHRGMTREQIEIHHIKKRKGKIKNIGPDPDPLN